jgi:hypothetical protein
VEGLEAPDPRHRSLDPEVIALDPLLQVFGDVMRRRARQQAVFPGCGDRRRVGPRAIGADPVGGEQRLLLQHLAEEALSRVEITLRGEQQVDRVSVLVDGPVQIAPLAPDLDARTLMSVSSTRIEPQWGLRKVRSRRSIRGA